jgi:hypothetical protein
MSTELDKVLRDLLVGEIANKYLGLETLEARNSDSLDFHEVSVWSVKAALDAAYEAGRLAHLSTAIKKGKG